MNQIVNQQLSPYGGSYSPYSVGGTSGAEVPLRESVRHWCGERVNWFSPRYLSSTPEGTEEFCVRMSSELVNNDE